MENATIFLLIIMFVIILLLIVQFFISSGLSQINDQTVTAAADVDEIQVQIDANTLAIIPIQGQDVYKTASSGTTSFLGNVNVSDQLIVGTTNVLTELAYLEPIIESGDYKITSLSLNNITVTTKTKSNVTMTSNFFDSVKGISFICCPIGMVSTSYNDMYGNEIVYDYEILATQGRFPKGAEQHDNTYMINTGFSIVIWTDIYFKNVGDAPSFPVYTNSTQFPKFVDPGKYSRQMKSIVAYYKGNIWNPMGYTMPYWVPTTVPYP